MMEDWEKHKKNLLRVENVVAAMFFVSMIVLALKYVEESPWLGIPLILLDVIFMFCHCMSVYHEGASDAWRKAVDIQLKCQSEHRYRAIFWTYWEKNDDGPDIEYRNNYYNLACKLTGIDRRWDEEEKPDVAEKDDVYDLYPYKSNPVDCVLDARTIETGTLEQLFDLHNILCNKRNGIIHCCMEFVEEIEDGE